MALEQARKLGVAARTFATLVEEYRDISFGNVSGEAAYPHARDALDGLLALSDLDADDLRQVARLQGITASVLFHAQRPAEARALLEEALATDPAPAARAPLLATLGWLEWRLGRAEAAVAPLEEAVALAGQIGDQRLHRTSIHDLGIALSWLSDERGPKLLEQSFELAREAGDVNLLTRCYINLPSVRIGNGDAWQEITPVMDEGLDRARRRVDPMAISWIAANYAELFWYRGRVHDALDLYVESVEAAARIGDRELEGTRRVGIAAMSLLLGDRARAEGHLDDETRRLTAAETQTKAYLATVELWLAWPAVEPVIDAVLERERDGEIMGNPDVIGLPIARAALVERAIGKATGPRARLSRAWAAGLVDADAGSDARIVGVAGELETLGYLMHAADALADAAIVAARQGRDGLAIAERARALYAGSSIVPPFGDPVEAIADVAAVRPA